MKVLIGYDGSGCADDAMDGLQRAGLPRDTEVMVLSVADMWLDLPGSCYEPPGAVPLGEMAPAVRKAHSLAAEAMAEARIQSANAKNRLAKQFPDWTVHVESCAGSPHESLILKADAWKADLVVVGSHGRSATGRLFFGSVSQKVVRYAPCSVRVSRQLPERGSRPLRIVVAIDASPNAAMAVAAVAQRSWPANTEVKAVMAMDVRLATALPTIVENFGSEGSDWAPRATERASKELRAAGLLATPVLREGDPKKVLIEEAEQWDADCIFVGARGLSRVQRFLLGSVSAAVATRAHCSVEVVRAG